ncbi:2131_t:CDS:2, partial [Racocetra persica]
ENNKISSYLQAIVENCEENDENKGEENDESKGKENDEYEGEKYEGIFLRGKLDSDDELYAENVTDHKVLDMDIIDIDTMNIDEVM